jgi:cold-inducible RNA-binding protein
MDLVLSLAASLVHLARVDAAYPGLSTIGSIGLTNGAERNPRRLGAVGKIFTVATKLYIGNLDPSTSESELRALFAQHGSVASADIVLDRVTGRSRGFGFVVYESADDAQRAIGSLDGAQLNGRQIGVSPARERDGSRGRGAGAGPSGVRRERW